MKTKDLRASLREFIVSTNGKISPAELADDTPLIEERIITSLQLPDLILFLERLRGEPLDLGRLRGSSFRDLNALYDNFLAGVNHAQ
jgi:hypothetical protein